MTKEQITTAVRWWFGELRSKRYPMHVPHAKLFCKYLSAYLTEHQHDYCILDTFYSYNKVPRACPFLEYSRYQVEQKTGMIHNDEIWRIPIEMHLCKDGNVTVRIGYRGELITLEKETNSAGNRNGVRFSKLDSGTKN